MIFFIPQITYGILYSGLFLEQAREPEALYFAVGLSLFAGSEPGGLSLNLIWWDMLAVLNIFVEFQKSTLWPEKKDEKEKKQAK